MFCTMIDIAPWDFKLPLMGVRADDRLTGFCEGSLLRSDVLQLRLPVGPLGTGFDLLGIHVQREIQLSQQLAYRRRTHRIAHRTRSGQGEFMLQQVQ